VYLQPGQYAFPVNLPSAFFFPFGKKITEIPYNYKEAPWGDEIEHEILGPLIPPGKAIGMPSCCHHVMI
jgi:hypothetical protein